MGVASVLRALPSPPENVNVFGIMSLNDGHKAWQRQVGIMDHCLTLAMLNYEDGKQQRGEYYIDLAGQYYSELIKKARSGHTLAERKAA